MDQTPSLPSKRHRPSPLFNVLPSKHQTPPTVQNVQCWKPTPKIFSVTSLPQRQLPFTVENSVHHPSLLRARKGIQGVFRQSRRGP
ncbi:hypothetical protein IC582_004222 [Cucumis melo]